MGWSPLDLVIEKPDDRLGAKPCCEPRRDPADSCDLGLPMAAQFGNQLEPAFGAGLRKPDDLSSIQDGCDPAFSAAVRAMASSIRRAKSCQVKRRAWRRLAARMASRSRPNRRSADNRVCSKLRSEVGSK